MKTDSLARATDAYLSRYKGASRSHTASDLKVFLTWCTELEPLTVQHLQIELYVRWLQEIRRFRPSTVSRRLSVVAVFYRTCVIDGVLEHSPADHVRRPNVPPESPTLGLSHLQFEALLSASRQSTNSNDFALVGMLGLLGLRIFEATGADISDLGEEHGHGSCASLERRAGLSWFRFRQRSDGRLSGQSTIAAPGRFCATPLDRHPNYILAAYMASGT